MNLTSKVFCIIVLPALCTGCSLARRLSDSSASLAVRQIPHSDEGKASAEGGGTLAGVGRYFKDRGNDVIDVFAGTGIGVGFGLEASGRATDYARLAVGLAGSCKVKIERQPFPLQGEMVMGLPMPQFGGEPITYMRMADQRHTDEPLDESQDFIFIPRDRQRKPWIDRFDVGASATAIVPSASLNFSPGQAIDFLLGWFGADIGNDDGPPGEASPVEIGNAEE